MTDVQNLQAAIVGPNGSMAAIREAASPRNFLDICDLDATELREILDSSRAMKLRRRTPAAGSDQPLRGLKIATIFEQPSLRTRMSFEVAIRELGGEPIMVTGKEIELGERESIADTARVMSRYVDGIVIRMLDHAQLKEFAHHAAVPVINGLTKWSHPCQVMADMLTYEERRGPLAGATIAWVGDSNNVLTSWIQAGMRIPFTLRISTPAQYAPKPEVLSAARDGGAVIELVPDPMLAAAGADCVITDCWVSMGDTDDEARTAALRPFQVNRTLMAKADPAAIMMHCLPATRGEEVTDEVMDGPQSAVFDEAENRLHAQKGILAFLFGRSIPNF